LHLVVQSSLCSPKCMSFAFNCSSFMLVHSHLLQQDVTALVAPHLQHLQQLKTRNTCPPASHGHHPVIAAQMLLAAAAVVLSRVSCCPECSNLTRWAAEANGGGREDGARELAPMLTTDALDRPQRRTLTAARRPHWGNRTAPPVERRFEEEVEQREKRAKKRATTSWAKLMGRAELTRLPTC
jgi:hypothetical protein